MDALARYCDYAATTPIDEEVAALVLETERALFANTSSPHVFGRRASERVEEERARLAALLDADRVVFTGTGTEADNLAILGTPLGEGQLLISALEHKAVTRAARKRARRDGRKLRELPVDAQGQVRLDALEEALAEPTALVSVMAANNEMGAVQPLAEIARLAGAAGAWVHTDAIQSAGKVPLSLAALGLDAAALSAHKFYGPKGVGALALRGEPALEPVLVGGGHQFGLRPGTEDTPRIVGMVRALEKMLAAREAENARLAALRDGFERRMAELDGVRAVGAGGERLPHISALLVPRVSASALIDRLSFEGFGISSGSACSTGEPKPSAVMLAIGLTPRDAKSVVRISLGSHSDEASVAALEACLRKHIAGLRALAPA